MLFVVYNMEKSSRKMERMKAMKPHLLFFDIDGTLRDEATGEVSVATRNAVKQAQKKGHIAFLNTGRSFAELDKEIMDVGFDGVVCGCGTYVDYKGENLLVESSAGEEAQRIVALLEKYKIQALLEGQYYFYISKYTNNKKLLQVKEYFGVEVNKKCRFWEDVQPEFQKLTVWLNKDSDFESFREELADRFEYIKRDFDFYEMVPKGHSKATGMHYLVEHLGIEKDRTVAIGDSTNDLSMLQFAGISVAMGNSCELVKEKVDFVTRSVEEEGVAYALEQLGFAN